MLAAFPASLVIYRAWNNTLSVTQQSIIVRRHGTKIELFDNIKAVFWGEEGVGGEGPQQLSKNTQRRAQAGTLNTDQLYDF